MEAKHSAPMRKFAAYKKRVLELLCEQEGVWVHGKTIAIHLNDPTKNCVRTYRALNQLRTDIADGNHGRLLKDGKQGKGYRWKFIPNV